MLEESTDLRVGDRLSRVVHLFQNDPRWKVRPCHDRQLWGALSRQNR